VAQQFLFVILFFSAGHHLKSKSQWDQMFPDCLYKERFYRKVNSKPQLLQQGFRKFAVDFEDGLISKICRLNLAQERIHLKRRMPFRKM
jgi:hypothetical protein